MKILIVEDDFISRQLMRKFIMAFGEYDIAVNGEEAVKLFENAIAEQKLYDIIFLDVMMPEMDGYSVLKKVREIESENEISEEKTVKIVMTTSIGESNKIIEAYREQCDEYIVKPIEKSRVEEILEKLSKQVR